MWPLVRRRYALPVLLLFAHGCGSCYSADRPEPPSTSDVTALKIAPSTVFVVPGAIFVMRARILDGLGGVLPSHPDLAWSPGSGLSVVSKGADSAVVKANMLTSGTSLKSTITAQLGTHNAAASVTVLAQTAAGTNDIALGDNRNAMQPDVVLLDDLTAPIPIDDSLIAFVGIGLLGNLSGGTGEVARFASDQAFYREPVSWQVTKDVIDMRTPPPGTGPEPVETRAPIVATFRIWIASSKTGISTDADNDVKYATRVFRRERTGVALRALRPPGGKFGSITLGSGTNLCADIRAKLQALDVPSPNTSLAFSKESLNVVYVDDVVLPPTSPEEVLTPHGTAGYACPPDLVAAGAGTVILISAQRRGSGTLTHELGHALGLHEPESGHTNLVQGFSYTNMMWNSAGDIGTAPRSTFSLGQAFRINMDDHSWLHFVTGNTRNCDSTKVDRSCPPLEKEFP